MDYRLHAYAQDAVSFLIQSLGKRMEKVKEIILYGSVARGQATSESDIDLFVNTSDLSLEKDVLRSIDEFYQSMKFTRYWKLLGVENEIQCMVGDLAAWRNLKRSIISQGITLYGKYHERYEASHYALFIISGKEKRSEAVKLWRKLYGYRQKVGKKMYLSPGLVEKYRGKKLAKGIFFLPLQHTEEVIRFLRSHKVRYRLLEVQTDKEW